MQDQRASGLIGAVVARTMPKPAVMKTSTTGLDLDVHGVGGLLLFDGVLLQGGAVITWPVKVARRFSGWPAV